MSGYIFQLNMSAGGAPKRAVESATLTETGLVGDLQAHRRFHGGPQRALCLYGLEIIRELQAEGHPVYPGSVGENVTVAGLEWTRFEPGIKLRLGPEVLIEISSYTAPCKNIAPSFTDGAFNRISQKQHPGWSRVYARVLEMGQLRVGQTVSFIE